MAQEKSIGECFSSISSEEKVTYKSRLTFSLKCLRFILRQGLACRGHDESEDSLNRGNFCELLKRLSQNFEEVNKVFLKNAPKNAQMASLPIQKTSLTLVPKKLLGLSCKTLVRNSFQYLLMNLVMYTIMNNWLFSC